MSDKKNIGNKESQKKPFEKGNANPDRFPEDTQAGNIHHNEAIMEVHKHPHHIAHKKKMG